MSLLLVLIVSYAIAASADKITATQTATGWTLYGGQQITFAQVDKIKAALNTPSTILPTESYFWHWTTWNTCIRRAATQISSGEMDYLVDNDDGMRVGGGLYIARNPVSSTIYGPCPLGVLIKAGTPVYDAKVVSTAGGISVPNIRVKSSLGTVVPFVDYYDQQFDWYVTHSAQNIARVEIGIRSWPSIPWWRDYANKPYLVRPKYTNAVALWEIIDGQDGIVSMMKKEMGVPDGDDRFNSLNYLRSFFILMQYIDGPSLVRAIRQFPSNPWDVFEPQKFGSYRDTWLAFINGRVRDPSGGPYAVFGYKYNIASKGVFGDGTGATSWSARQVNEVLPNLAKLLSGSSSPFAYRNGEVRAGGDETGQTFMATSYQVQILRSNPYLVVNANKLDNGFYLVYYYYPDPMHLNPALKSKVSAALWTKMTGTNYTSRDDPAFKTDCAKLINELLLDSFNRHYGVDISVTATNSLDGLSMILELVSIHPFLDYNGRTTRFYLCAAHIEGAFKNANGWFKGDPPVAFISDFDLVTSKPLYANEVNPSTTATGNLRIQLLAEWGRSLNPRYGPANYFKLDAWQIYENEAMSWAGKNIEIDFNTDADFEMIRKRQWVPLLDAKLGPSWPGRN